MANEVDLSYRDRKSASGFICPDCGGALRERDEEGAKFRCRIGHAYSPESLLDAEGESIESALWNAVRSLEESAAIARRVASMIPAASSEFEEKAKERMRRARVIRALLSREEGQQSGRDMLDWRLSGLKSDRTLWRQPRLPRLWCRRAPPYSAPSAS